MTMRDWTTRWGAEAALAVLATLVFIGFLGSVDLWGKREQRAALETLDTIDHHHWLVAEIQGRPRLEKPPLPRWTIATLMLITGRQDEWIVRLPSACSALGMVGLCYCLGRRMAGRTMGLVSGFALTTTGFFISELRQAGNDGPLAFFTTLALYAAWRRLHPVDQWSTHSAADVDDDRAQLGSWGWVFTMYVALGLGFLCKGPIAVLLAAVTLLPFLAITRQFGRGLKALWSGWGVVAFLVLAASWPVPAAIAMPKAVSVWILEMGQKAGTAGIKHHQKRFLAQDWPMMTAPWSLLAIWAAAMPFLRTARAHRSAIWFTWCWAIGNLAMFSLWSVAKPNYYLPCLPGAALMVGLNWVRITSLARESGSAAMRALWLLRVHWILYAVAAIAIPVVAYYYNTRYLGWAIAAGSAFAITAYLSRSLWLRGRDAEAFASLAGAVAVCVLIAYSAIAPRYNSVQSHRALAARLEQLLPADQPVVMFYKALDEGLWFYLRNRSLAPIPGTQPRYNKDIDLVDDYKSGKLIWSEKLRIRKERQGFIDWLRDAPHDSRFVLIRSRDYDYFSPGLEEYASLVFREPPLARNELTLLEIKPRTVAVKPANATKQN